MALGAMCCDLTTLILGNWIGGVMLEVDNQTFVALLWRSWNHAWLDVGTWPYLWFFLHEPCVSQRFSWFAQPISIYGDILGWTERQKMEPLCFESKLLTSSSSSFNSDGSVLQACLFKKKLPFHTEIYIKQGHYLALCWWGKIDTHSNTYKIVETK